MERLTQKETIDNENYFWIKNHAADTCCEMCEEISGECWHCPIYECMEKLAEYEDAEEQGRLIEFPAAIGDHVWCFPSETEPYREMQVIGLSCEFGAKYVQVQDVITCDDVYFNVENLGMSMFTSKEQAEAKLKGMEGNYVKI